MFGFRLSHGILSTTFFLETRLNQTSDQSAEVNGKRRPIKFSLSKPESRFDSWPYATSMSTPALKPFLDGVGRVVHHLNTIVVGLAGVEAGQCLKPDGVDISWDPKDLTTSSRSARRFALDSALVFVAEELSAYVHLVRGLPGQAKDPTSSETEGRASRFSGLSSALLIEEPDLVNGPLLMIHWRNRLIHKGSSAALTQKQRRAFLEASGLFAERYKNFCPEAALEHFESRRATLKDISSLTAMTINAVKRIDDALQEPGDREELLDWLDKFGLRTELNRVMRTPAANSQRAIENFFSTHCPSLKASYGRYGVSDA